MPYEKNNCIAIYIIRRRYGFIGPRRFWIKRN